MGASHQADPLAFDRRKNEWHQEHDSGPTHSREASGRTNERTQHYGTRPSVSTILAGVGWSVGVGLEALPGVWEHADDQEQQLQTRFLTPRSENIILTLGQAANESAAGAAR
jgi:hypothetical protein